MWCWNTLEGIIMWMKWMCLSGWLMWMLWEWVRLRSTNSTLLYPYSHYQIQNPLTHTRAHVHENPFTNQSNYTNLTHWSSAKFPGILHILYRIIWLILYGIPSLLNNRGENLPEFYLTNWLSDENTKKLLWYPRMLLSWPCRHWPINIRTSQCDTFMCCGWLCICYLLSNSYS